jgi:hypothetical protein
MKTRKERQSREKLLKAFVWVFLGVFVFSAVGVAMIIVVPHN